MDAPAFVTFFGGLAPVGFMRDYFVSSETLLRAQLP